MDIIKKIAFILLVIGGLNWGLFGLFGEAGDLVAYLPEALATVVYILVGVSTLIVLFTMKGCCKTEEPESNDSMTQSEPQEPMSGAQM